MIRGIYTSASGLMAQQMKQETIANNVANINTTGYKRDQSLLTTFPHMLLTTVSRHFGPAAHRGVGSMNLGSLVEENAVVFTQGQVYETENPLDIALEGEGFFAVMTPDGIRYTRSGHFLRDSEGSLVTPQGYRVLGAAGPVTLPGENISVDQYGSITHNGQFIDRLALVEFENPETLRKQGGSFFEAVQQTQVDNNLGLNSRVHQGFLEGSNIDMVEEITQAITAFRIYEANQKALQAQDELLGKCVNEVGTLR